MSEEKTSTVSRRTVVKGIAWATPVVAVSTAIPAYASSPGCLTVTGKCYQPVGVSWTTFTYYIEITFTIRAGCTVVLNAIQASHFSFVPSRTSTISHISGLGFNEDHTLAGGPHTIRVSMSIPITTDPPRRVDFKFTSDAKDGTINVSPINCLFGRSLQETPESAAVAEAPAASEVSTPATSEVSTPATSEVPTPVTSEVSTPEVQASAPQDSTE